MKLRRFITISLAFVVICLLLCACGVAPTGYADYTSTEVTEPTPASVLKHPFSETVEIGGRATFISYSNSPGTTKWYLCDLSNREYTASDFHSRFPNVIIEGHTTETLSLSNIPYDLNGWQVYAVFNTKDGVVTSDKATITVVYPDIRITKNPTSEYIAYGTSTSFIAHADNAKSVIWYATDGSHTLPAADLSATYCPGLQIFDYDKDKLIIRNAPYSVSGWQFFACFDGINGPVYSEKATITVYTPTYPDPCPPCHPCNPCYPCKPGFPVIITPSCPYTPNVDVSTTTTTTTTVVVY